MIFQHFSKEKGEQFRILFLLADVIGVLLEIEFKNCSGDNLYSYMEAFKLSLRLGSNYLQVFFRF